MKRFAIPVMSVIVVAVSGFLVYRVQGENNAMKINVVLHESENRLLKDQIHDLEHKMQSARTYEEGLTDGLMRSNNRGYTDGYHAAMNQVAEQQQQNEKKPKAGN